MTTKLHIGNGTIYLKNWINVDIASDNCFLANERLDLLEQYITSEDNYYGRHSNKSLDKFRAGPKITETVTDRYGTWQNIPARSNSIDEILGRQTFEHFSINEAILALKESYRVLKIGSLLTIDVPDPEASIRLYRSTGDDFYIRHIFGPKQKGSWGWHCIGYTEPELTQLVESQGFRFKQINPNIHIYPAICLSFVKV